MATFQGQAAKKIAYKDAPIGKLADTLVCFFFFRISLGVFDLGGEYVY
jgi:hypothetical protein